MNVSMADALDLSWKLAHVLHNLSTAPQALLETFGTDLYQNASLVIDVDKKWYADKYMRHLQARTNTNLPPEAIGVEVWNFVLGLTIEYDESIPVHRSRRSGVVKGTNYIAGNFGEGRRVADCVVKRYADANPVHVQDLLVIDGKYHVLLFASSSFKKRDGQRWRNYSRNLPHAIHEALCGR